MAGTIMINDGKGFYTIPMNSVRSRASSSQRYFNSRRRETSGASFPFETDIDDDVRCAFYCSNKRRGKRLLYAQYNPEKLEYEYSATYAEMDSPGMNYPLFQFVRGNASEFQIDLFFFEGRSGDGSSIKYCHDWFEELLPPKKNNGSFTPKKVDIRVGYYKMKGVLQRMKVVDEWMSREGKPIMSRETLTFLRVGNSSYF